MDELTYIETTSMTELVHVRKHSAMNKPMIKPMTKSKFFSSPPSSSSLATRTENESHQKFILHYSARGMIC